MKGTWLTTTLVLLATFGVSQSIGIGKEVEVAKETQVNRPKFNDPSWKDSWHLLEETQPSMRIIDAWKRGFTGKGVVVTVIDDGLDYRHPDLIDNYDPDASYDINDDDSDPKPRLTYSGENRHGTRTAGLISASANNEVCSVGVAYKSSIGGIRLLDGYPDDKDEAEAFSFANNHTDIYVFSFGPDDNGKTVEGPEPKAMAAIEKAIKEGRGGKGNIFVTATGNGGRDSDDCNCDGYSNSIYTIAIGSVTSAATHPWYGETCSSKLAVTYSGGNASHKEMVTTSLDNRCTKKHTGNSASVALAAGICALTLEANPYLTWRDMQHLIVQTSNPQGLKSDDWITNAVGRKVSRKFGYGLMDAEAMVTKAQNWTHVPKQVSCQVSLHGSKWYVDNDQPRRLQIPTSVCENGGELPDRLEHVVLTINTFKVYRLGILSIHLESPSRTKSKMLGQRNAFDAYRRAFENWNFTSVHFWDENPLGDWIVTFERKDYQTIKSPIVLTFYGTLDKDWKEPTTDFTTTSEAKTEATQVDHRTQTSPQLETTTRGPATSPVTVPDTEEEQQYKLLKQFRYLVCRTVCNIQALVHPEKPCEC